MQVSNLLANKNQDVATISQERTVNDALQLLKERGIGALVVTGPTPPLVGIFSERDAVRALATSGARALETTVAELMSTDVQTCEMCIRDRLRTSCSAWKDWIERSAPPSPVSYTHLDVYKRQRLN